MYTNITSTIYKIKNRESTNMTVKYIRLESSANVAKRIEISNRIIRGEIKLSHYAVDNDIFYHYYEILIPLTNKKK